jgi:sphingolipid delta-4 desaturase
MKLTEATATSSDFIHVTYAEPHIGRTRQILKTHPELKKLFGNEPTSFFWILGIVALQTVLAYALRSQPFWLVLLTSYVIGAVANHSLFVLIHEATHNLIFRNSNLNRLSGILANFPICFPAAISFRKYHLIHHRYQGDMELDADLPGPKESKFIGNSSVLKTIWISFFFVVYGLLRPTRLSRVKLWDAWTVFNFGVEIGYLALIFSVGGAYGLLYLFLSSCFAIGLHPLGARWVQEHFVIKPNQETYSYYGPFNKLMFNVGFHNEHHDLMMVPWSRLPLVRAGAPEFYDSLYSHRSYFRLLALFLFDPKVGLHSRVVRPSKNKQPRMNAELAESNAAAGLYGGVLPTEAQATPAEMA